MFFQYFLIFFVLYSPFGYMLFAIVHDLIGLLIRRLIICLIVLHFLQRIKFLQDFLEVWGSLF